MVYVYVAWQVAMRLLVGPTGLVALRALLDLLGGALVIAIFGGIVTWFSHDGKRMCELGKIYKGLTIVGSIPQCQRLLR